VSSNDFDGPFFRPAGGQGADDQEAGANGATAQGTGNGGLGAAGGPRYQAPEGWGDDGFWRDSSIDADYETNTQRPIRPGTHGSHGDPRYSYFSDGNGWQNSQNPATRPGQSGDSAWPAQAP